VTLFFRLTSAQATSFMLRVTKRDFHWFALILLFSFLNRSFSEFHNANLAHVTTSCSFVEASLTT